MSKIVWTFGLIAAAVMAGMFFLTFAVMDKPADKWVIVGFTTMFAAFLMVYFGIRSYRDTVLAGSIGFWRACQVGVLIALIASAGYVGAWEVIEHTMVPDFGEKYAAAVVEKARARGATGAALEKKQQEMAKFVEDYKNPVINVAYTLMEVFPVGLVFVLISAGVLRRNPAGAKVMAG